ncbi:Trp biosynthesis-associated membrane protein [Humidisolicoccus flavus]|uniref:Trp biosynthesis-associated membrane protein n=1 Tax=Humidisolicoccus flavus TaxID=3111414 RepID=UPI003246E3B9
MTEDDLSKQRADEVSKQPADHEAVVASADEFANAAVSTRRFAVQRRMAVLGLALLSIVVVIAASQTWFTVTITGVEAIEVSGLVVSGASAPLALATLALAATLTIAGPVSARILLVLAIILGACTSLAAWLGFTDPGAALESVIAEATGVSGSGQAALIEQLTASFWPSAVVLLGVLIAVLAVVALLSVSTWVGRSTTRSASRFERHSALDWDELDDGIDPTRS